jgi:hypothetical protein
MQHLRLRRFHPRAFAGGENDDVEVGHGRQPSMISRYPGMAAGEAAIDASEAYGGRFWTG